MAFVQNTKNYEPLEDDSITEATSISLDNDLSEYRPFKKKDSNYESTHKADTPDLPEASPNTAAVNQLDAVQQQSIQQLQQKQQELDAKAEQLEEKEKNLKKTEIEIKDSESTHNFPPVPSCCPCEACFYQDIEADIPVQYQKLVNILFYSWIAYIVLLVWNMLICMAYFITTVECNLSNHSAVNFTLALFNIILFTPASYVFWFRPIYKAFKYESSINFFVFFFIFSLQFIANIFQCLAIDGWGFVGILNCLDMFSAGQTSASAVGVFMLLTGVGFGALAGLNLFLLIRVHQVYRTSGGSLARAQKEFSTDGSENKVWKSMIGLNKRRR